MLSSSPYAVHQAILQPDVCSRMTPFLTFCFKVTLRVFFLMHFDALIPNILSSFQNSGKNAVAGRLKVNFGQF